LGFKKRASARDPAKLCNDGHGRHTTPQSVARAGETAILLRWPCSGPLPPPPDSAISSLYRYTSAMPPCRTPAEIIALSLLARDGIAAIWGLHLSAALAYRDGRKAVAAGVIEIADAAEREWLRAKAAVTGSPG
jgi:hypothetical protein